MTNHSRGDERIWLVCSECRRPVNPCDDGCRHCGSMFEEDEDGR